MLGRVYGSVVSNEEKEVVMIHGEINRMPQSRYTHDGRRMALHLLCPDLLLAWQGKPLE